MQEIINQEVSVVMIYSARKKKAAPHVIHWQNRDYKVDEIGYEHKVKEGTTLIHIFELTVKEADLWMRLALNTDNLHWNLEAVSDGIAS